MSSLETRVSENEVQISRAELISPCAVDFVSLPESPVKYPRSIRAGQVSAELAHEHSQSLMKKLRLTFCECYRRPRIPRGDQVISL